MRDLGDTAEGVIRIAVDVVVGGADRGRYAGLATEDVIAVGKLYIIRQTGEVLGGGGQVSKDRVGVVEVVIAVTDGRDTPGLVVRCGVRLLDVLRDVGVGEVIIPFLGCLTRERIEGVVQDPTVAVENKDSRPLYSSRRRRRGYCTTSRLSGTTRNRGCNQSSPPLICPKSGVDPHACQVSRVDPHDPMTELTGVVQNKRFPPRRTTTSEVIRHVP